MPNGDGAIVEEVAVRVTADGLQALEDIEATVAGAETQMQSLGDTVESMDAQIEGFASKIVEFANETGVSLEEAARQIKEVFSEAAKFSDEELLAAAESFEEQLQGRIVQAINEMERALQANGLAVDTNREALVQYLTTAAAGSETLDEATEKINQIKDKLVQQATAAGQAGGQFADAVEEGAEAIRDQTEATEEGEGPRNALGQFFQTQVGQIGQFVTGLLAGVSVLRVLQSIVQEIQQSINVAQQLGEAQDQLTRSTLTLQRSIGENAGTLAEWNQLVGDLAARLRVSDAEIAQSLSQFQTYAIRLNLTRDELFGVVEASADLARAQGKDLLPVLRSVGRFIETGQKEALEDYGILVTDTALREQARAMNLSDNLKLLTEAELQQVRYNVALEQMGIFTEAAGQNLGTQTERLMDLRREQTEVQQIMGKALLPAFVRWNEIMLTGRKLLASLVLVVQEISIALGAELRGALAGVAAAWEVFNEQLRTGRFDAQAIIDAFSAVRDQVNQQLREAGRQELADALQGTTEAVDDFLDQNEDDVEDWGEGVQSAIDRAGKAILRLEAQWEEGLARARQRLADRLEDIARDFARRRRDLERDLQRDLEEIDREAAEARRKAIIQAQVDERRLREDFQRDIRDMERRFLLDLEDAVRERDARRIIQLTRQFNLERMEREEEFETALQRRREDFQLELAEIERQRQIRREERLREYREELIDLQEQQSRKIEEAQRAFQREIRDLQQRINVRLQLIAEGFAAETEMTVTHVEQLRSILESAYGAGGFVEQFIQRYRQLLMQGQAGGIGGPVVPVAPGDVGGGNTQNLPNDPTNLFPFQRGTLGSIFTSPTNLRVAEARPERVSVTPLSPSGVPAAGFRGQGGAGSMMVRIMLDEGLVGEIVDQTMGETAKVVLESVGRR